MGIIIISFLNSYNRININCNMLEIYRFTSFSRVILVRFSTIFYYPKISPYLRSFTYFDIINLLSFSFPPNLMVSLALSKTPLIPSISPSPKSLCTTLSPMEYFAMVSFLLFEKFIDGILGITRVSKMSNHPMDDITNGHRILALNRLQMLLILYGGTK